MRKLHGEPSLFLSRAVAGDNRQFAQTGEGEKAGSSQCRGRNYYLAAKFYSCLQKLAEAGLFRPAHDRLDSFATLCHSPCGYLIPLSRHLTLSGRIRFTLTVRLPRPNPARTPPSNSKLNPAPRKATM